MEMFKSAVTIDYEGPYSGPLRDVARMFFLRAEQYRECRLIETARVIERISHKLREIAAELMDEAL